MRKSKKIWTYALLQRDGSYENKKGRFCNRIYAETPHVVGLL